MDCFSFDVVEFRVYGLGCVGLCAFVLFVPRFEFVYCTLRVCLFAGCLDCVMVDYNCYGCLLYFMAGCTLGFAFWMDTQGCAILLSELIIMC